MKKIVYIGLACIIILGAVIILTMGLNADISYSKNVEIDIHVGKKVDIEEIKQIAKEVFPKERLKVQEIEFFEDTVSITMQEKTDKELEEQVEQLNTKINEKYGVSNTVEKNVSIVHNPKVKLSSIMKPYILPIAISAIIIIVYAVIRYKKLGMLKIAVSYLVYPLVGEATYLSILAITRFPINRLVVPLGIVLYVVIVTVLSFVNERKLVQTAQTENKKKK